MNTYGVITGIIRSPVTVSGSLHGAAAVTGGLTIPTERPVREYEGAYEFTPSQSEQTVEIGGLWAREDIIIKPIPSNYGLIEWDGSTLTVS